MKRAFLDTAYGQVHYLVAGAGEPVFLLHQTPRSSDQFTEIIPLLTPKKRVIAVDNLGYGDSDKPRQQLSIEDYAAVVLQLMDDLRSADVDFLTIGQYLQPTRKHHPVVRYVTPEEFKAYETIAYAKGFLMVSASPLTRSSHHAGEDFARLQAARAARGDG